MPTEALTPAPHPSHQGTLDDYLDAGGIMPLPQIPPDEWQRLRGSAVRRMLWHFCTFRNVVAYRGRFHHDILGFGWAALYRTLRVGAVAVTSFRNEGHFRAGERILGTGDFASIFRDGRDSPNLQSMIRMVNLRHHVAGVVVPCPVTDLPLDCSAWLPAGTRLAVRVVDGYEADYAFISTAFIENLRRGLEICGLPRNTASGRKVAEEMCTLMYQAAGAVGLTRIPRDLAAHDRFVQAYDAAFEKRPPSPRVQRMAQEIAKRILPVTAAMTGIPLKAHLERHVDPVSRAWLFPDPARTLAEVEPWFAQWQERRRTQRSRLVQSLAQHRRDVWAREDIALLWDAYGRADPTGPEARLIGAILLHAIDEPSDPLRRYVPETVTVGPDKPLISQGEEVRRMVVVLEASEPLVVTRTETSNGQPRELGERFAPNVFGEIGMWRRSPAMATLFSRRPATLRVIFIDGPQFDALKTDSGFRAATAGSVQRRLAFDSHSLARALEQQARAADDARLQSVAQLLAYLGGNSHAPLDAVIDLPDDATPAECLDALREQAHALVEARQLPDDVRRSLETVVALVG